ncbi:uncharacterized protein A4U43_C03F14330 [Asparagus officinalis]|uniref:Uncharacterized protein n=1 Tax=Asparagus officinalis TaxID=4686 RepID=A0A5P1FBS0_ASPOF|nr:uncharacterized protein A4U43_C03F14330 [Asparagus officinalis]
MASTGWRSHTPAPSSPQTQTSSPAPPPAPTVASKSLQPLLHPMLNFHKAVISNSIANFRPSKEDIDYIARLERFTVITSGAAASNLFPWFTFPLRLEE